MSDCKIRQVFMSRCYDEREDDPWVHRRCLKQDHLLEGMKPHRCRPAEHLLAQAPGAWFNHAAIDP